MNFRTIQAVKEKKTHAIPGCRTRVAVYIIIILCVRLIVSYTLHYIIIHKIPIENYFNTFVGLHSASIRLKFAGMYKRVHTT